MIPATADKNFTTRYDNQTAMRISVYEGESSACRDNSLLGSFVLDGITPAARGVPPNCAAERDLPSKASMCCTHEVN